MLRTICAVGMWTTLLAGGALTVHSAAMPPPEAVVPASYNVQEFGSRGDGLTDDTNMIQAAIEVFEASQGSANTL